MEQVPKSHWLQQEWRVNKCYTNIVISNTRGEKMQHNFPVGLILRHFSPACIKSPFAELSKFKSYLYDSLTSLVWKM